MGVFDIRTARGCGGGALTSCLSLASGGFRRASFLTDAKQYGKARELLETHVLVPSTGARTSHTRPLTRSVELSPPCRNVSHEGWNVPTPCVLTNPTSSLGRNWRRNRHLVCEALVGSSVKKRHM